MKALKNINIQDLLFLDIESRTLVENLEESTPMYDSWVYKTRYMGEADKMGIPNKTPEDSYQEKGPLYAEFAAVCCATLGRVSDGEFKMKSYYSFDEKELLSALGEDLAMFQSKRPVTLVGHSIFGYDIPFLMRRYICNQIIIPDCLDTANEKKWNIPHIDIADLWKSTSWYSASLLNMCVALNIESPKSDISGGDVSEVFWKQKDLERIRQYCEKDVFASYEIYKKLAYIK